MGRREVTEDDVPRNDSPFLKFGELFSRVGDTFAGLYQSDKEGTYGQDYTFKLRDGSVGTLTVKGPLKNQLAKAAPQRGELITIKVSGMREQFFIFKVIVDDAPAGKSKPPPAPTSDDPSNW